LLETEGGCARACLARASTRAPNASPTRSLTNSIMMHGRNNGKKIMAVSVCEECARWWLAAPMEGS
jgi:hypothetical protein